MKLENTTNDVTNFKFLCCMTLRGHHTRMRCLRPINVYHSKSAFGRTDHVL